MYLYTFNLKLLEHMEIGRKKNTVDSYKLLDYICLSLIANYIAMTFNVVRQIETAAFTSVD